MISISLKVRRAVLVAAVALPALAFSSMSIAVGIFDSGIPAGWSCNGKCGTSPADGVVTLAPGGGSMYGWVSTNGGVTPMPGLSQGGEKDGSTLQSLQFSATGGQILEFLFNYVTSDGAGFSDYGWAQLLDSSSVPVALLFDARTTPTGNTVPGVGLPAIDGKVTPPSTPIIPGGPSFTPLGSYSGKCFFTGCGYTGWLTSDYTIGSSGNYSLLFGVVNWADTIFDSALAFDGITVGGQPIESPEPATLSLLGLGLVGLGLARRRRTR